MGTEKDNDDHDKDCHDKHDKCRDHCHDHDHDHDDCKKKDDCKKRDCDDWKYSEHYKYREYTKYREHDDDKCHDDHKKGRHYQSHHIHELEKTIRALADALAALGRGAHLHELLRLIHQPGWTTPAELAFVNAILDHISVDVRALDRLQADLVEASRKVVKVRDRD